jgi:hypothetical protein
MAGGPRPIVQANIVSHVQSSFDGGEGSPPGAHAFAVTYVTGAPANLRHHAPIGNRGRVGQVSITRAGSPQWQDGCERSNVMNKILVLSLIALGLGFAAPAVAKDQTHQWTSAYASASHDDGARDEMHGNRQPEPAYMAYQTKSWADSD